MNLPPKKNRGDPILARDWNLLVDAVAARTPRTGSGLHLSQTAAGFAYQFPAWPQVQRVTPPPFGVIGIEAGQDGSVFTVRIREGWVIERKAAGEGGGPVVVFHMPKYGSTGLDGVPRPALPMTDGDTAWCVYQTDMRGEVTGTPEIIVSTADQQQVHYAPVDPKGDGLGGTYAVKLLKLALENGSPVVAPFQQSDIEHCAQLWTGENLGGGRKVYKEHDEASNTYKFRTLVAGANVALEELDDSIKISFSYSYGSGTGGTP